MKRNRCFLPFVNSAVCTSLSLLSVNAFAQTGAQVEEGRQPNSAIVVTAKREAERQAVKDLTDEVTKPVRFRKTLARYHDRLCFATLKIDRYFALPILDRLSANAESLGLGLAGENCKPNAVIVFVRDINVEFESLRKDAGWIFGDLRTYEIDQAEQGSDFVRAWNVTETQGADGMTFSSIELAPGLAVDVNQQIQSSRIVETTRQNIFFSVVLIDLSSVAGKTPRQIADYATMRLLAPTIDAAENKSDTPSTILTLFSNVEDPPREWTRFDKSYMRALYGLSTNGKPGSLIGATAIKYDEFDDDATEPEE